MEKYIPQLIATAIVILFMPVSKFIFRKIIWKIGTLNLKSEVRILHIIRVVSMCINIICITSLTVIWGVDPRNMLVALSSIFAVIGVAMFAQWSILSNITAGIIIFFSMPFKIGDEIKILDKEIPIDAMVENVLTFTIHLRTAEGELIILSNSQFLQKTILVKNR